MSVCLAGWLADWLAGWLAGSLSYLQLGHSKWCCNGNEVCSTTKPNKCEVCDGGNSKTPRLNVTRKPRYRGVPGAMMATSPVATSGSSKASSRYRSLLQHHDFLAGRAVSRGRLVTPSCDPTKSQSCEISCDHVYDVNGKPVIASQSIDLIIRSLCSVSPSVLSINHPWNVA